jgi:hypothetical protein
MGDGWEQLPFITSEQPIRTGLVCYGWLKFLASHCVTSLRAQVTLTLSSRNQPPSTISPTKANRYPRCAMNDAVKIWVHDVVAREQLFCLR